jgi:hypothetical protein
MSEINHFKKFVLCSGDVTANVNHLHMKRIHLESLVGYLNIVREDSEIRTRTFTIMSCTEIKWLVKGTAIRAARNSTQYS